MKALVAYATKSGATRLCAQLVAERIPSTAVVDLAREQPDPSTFDAVVIGSGIRMGKLYRPALRFLSAHAPTLLDRPLLLFACNAYPDALSQTMRENVEPALLGHALCTLSLGGLPPFRKASFSTWADEEAIDLLCAKLRSVGA